MATTTIKTVITIRRAMAADWEAHKDVVPACGEPCFVIDQNILKIGDGATTFENLEPINGVHASISADGRSIILDDGSFKLAGFDAAQNGAQLRKSATGEIEWVMPSTDTVDGLQSAVAGLQSDVSSLQEIVGSKQDGKDTLISRISEIESGINVLNGSESTDGSVIKMIKDEINAFATNVSDDGVVNSYKELIDYVAEHGNEAASMAADISSLKQLVGETPVQEQIKSIVNSNETISRKKSDAVYKNVQYEIISKPNGTLVDYRDKEIRVMCPVNTAWTLQESGENADQSKYYIGFRAYAPSGAVGFKEGLSETITDDKMYSFEGNDFAGTDEFGRKYSVVWLPVAEHNGDTDEWTYYGVNSNSGKYIGWYYSVNWYNSDGAVIGSDTIRVNLANESCFNDIKPFYLNDAVCQIKTIALGETLLDIVDKNVTIPVGAGLKASDEIGINEDGTLGIKNISFSKIKQSDDEVIVFDGGDASM